MPIVTIEQARAHCRLESDYPDDQLQPYVDGAVGSAQDFLNRLLFESNEALNAALDALPQAAADAAAAYADAVTAAGELSDSSAQAMALAVAERRRESGRRIRDLTLHGMVADPTTVDAVLLTLGHLFENRGDTVVGAIAMELPNGARTLLRPKRRVMMP